jgi:hypothetical protein
MLDCKLDDFVEKVNNESITLELIKTLVYLSQYIDNKLFKMSTVSNPKVRRDGQFKFNTQRSSSIDQLFSKQTKTLLFVQDEEARKTLMAKSFVTRMREEIEPVTLVLNKHSKNKPRSEMDLQMTVNMINGASILKDIISMFLQYYPGGADPIAKKIIEYWRYLKSTDSLLKSRLIGFVTTYRDKLETLTNLDKIIIEILGAESVFVEHGIYIMTK